MRKLVLLLVGVGACCPSFGQQATTAIDAATKLTDQIRSQEAAADAETQTTVLTAAQEAVEALPASLDPDTRAARVNEIRAIARTRLEASRNRRVRILVATSTAYRSLGQASLLLPFANKKQAEIEQLILEAHAALAGVP